MKQLFRRLQRRRRYRSSATPNEPVVSPPPPILPHGLPSTVVVEPKTGRDGDATTVSRYTMDSRGHFALQTDMDEAIVQVAVSAIAMAIANPKANARTGPNNNAKTATSMKEEHNHKNDSDDNMNVAGEQDYANCKDSTTLVYHETQATLAVERSNWQVALFHYEHALRCLEDSTMWSTETLGTISTILNNLAYASQVVRYASSDKIIRYYQAALSIKRHVYGKLHESTAKTLNNLGSTHYLNRQFHPAASYYEEARDILRLLPNARHLAHEIATISSNLGDVHYCLHQYERANLEYRSSLRLRWNLYAKSDGKITRLLEQIATTEQKKYNDDDGDDSSSVSSGRSRGSWNQEIEQLQTELSVDLEFLDALEHSVPIQMAKDKAVVFRELRHLTTTAAATTTSHDMLGDPLNVLREATVAATLADPVQCNAVTPDSSTDTTTTTMRQSETVGESSLLQPCGGGWTVVGKFPVVKPLNEESGTTAKAMRHFDNVNSLKEESSSSVTKDRQDPLSRMSSTSVTIESTIVITPPATPTRTRAVRQTLLTSPTAAQRILTRDERQAALMDVKTRLAQLRASRKSCSNNNDGSPMIIAGVKDTM